MIAKSQVAAYDPDEDTLRFRFGSANEYGGITKSKSSAFPKTQVDADLSTGSYADARCSSSNKFYQLNGTCPTVGSKPPKPLFEQRSSLLVRSLWVLGS